MRRRRRRRRLCCFCFDKGRIFSTSVYATLTLQKTQKVPMKKRLSVFF